MPNSRHREAMLSPSLSRTTNRIRSSMTDRSFHGIHSPRPLRGQESVTHVSGTFCHLCLGTVKALTPPSLDFLPSNFPRNFPYAERFRRRISTCTTEIFYARENDLR